jgi:hypothetical protein
MAMAVEMRMALRTLSGAGPTPAAPGALWSILPGDPAARRDEGALSRQQLILPHTSDGNRAVNLVVGRRLVGGGVALRVGHEAQVVQTHANTDTVIQLAAQPAEYPVQQLIGTIHGNHGQRVQDESAYALATISFASKRFRLQGSSIAASYRLRVRQPRRSSERPRPDKWLDLSGRQCQQPRIPRSTFRWLPA